MQLNEVPSSDNSLDNGQKKRGYMQTLLSQVFFYNTGYE